MRHFVPSFVLALLLVSGTVAQEKDVNPEKLVNWMCSINTLQFEFKEANHKFATSDELRAFAAKPTTSSAVVVTKELTPSAMAPYALQVTTSGDGTHYLATIKRPSDMHNKATWCKTAVFSDDSGLIYIGQNIGCSGADKLVSFNKN
jgi:hypothetical protein